MFLKNHKTSKHLKVSLPDGKQEIVVGKGLSSWVIEKLASSDYSGFVIFCDHNIANIYQDFLAEIKNKLKPAEIILIKPTEANKSIEFLNLCLERCLKANLNRNGCLIAIGGGIVGDVTGFLASVYMRGIDMVFVPTTLMAQGDTIINKVAISYKLLKNVIGSFTLLDLLFATLIFYNRCPRKKSVWDSAKLLNMLLSPRQNLPRIYLKYYCHQYSAGKITIGITSSMNL